MDIISFLPSYFHWWHLPVVLLAGMVAEGYAVIIGGGGVLIQFVLFSLGMPLPVVIATDIGGCLGSGLGVITAYSKDIWGNKRLLCYLSVPFFIGGIIGTLFLTKISPVILSYVLIIAFGTLLILMALQKNQQTQNLAELNVNKKQYPLLASVLVGLGIYTNVSGVGSGTFTRIVYTSLLKMKANDSIGVGNIVYFPPTIFSFVVTAVAGLLAWPYVITLWVGTFIGAHYVAKYAQKIPENYLRKALMFICLMYLLYLLFKIVQ